MIPLAVAVGGEVGGWDAEIEVGGKDWTYKVEVMASVDGEGWPVEVWVGDTE